MAHTTNLQSMKKIRRVFLTGGGTAGSVSPLLAVAEEIQRQQYPAQLWFVGTSHGVERSMITALQSCIPMTYLAVPAGKFRRYWDWRNLTDPFIVLMALMKSLYFIIRYRPEVIVSVGSYVSTPIIWAGWLCGKRTVIHQQDIEVGLTTTLTKPFATVVTKAFADTPLAGAEVIGNPVRDLTPTTDTIQLDPDFPTLFIFGGGTGAQALNDLVSPELCAFANVIHVTGQGKTGPDMSHVRYHAFALLQAEMAEAYAKADVVVARAGLATISELAALGKPAVIIPIPHSHQERNADMLTRHNVALVLDQANLTQETLAVRLRNLVGNPTQQATFAKHMVELLPAGAATKLVGHILVGHTLDR